MASALASAHYEYDYNSLSRLIGVDQTLVGLTPEVVFDFSYDLLGRRTIQYSSIGGTTDFLNFYQYDPLSRLKELHQIGFGGNAVATKHAVFAYNAAGQFDSIKRYADFATSNHVATSTYGYNNAGRLNDLVHQRNNGSGLGTPQGR